MPITRPVNLQVPFANTGSKNTIPVASQIGIVAGAASFTDGFPPLTTTPIAAGGVPPAGADFNGILNILSQHTTFQNGGGKYRFDAALSTAIGGYPVGFVLQDDVGLNSYVNILAANTTNFNSTPASIGVSWIPYAGQAATQSGANIYGVDTGAANAAVVAFSPAVLALKDGMVLWFKAAAANTGATTLNVNGLGASPVVGGAHSALQGGEIIANGRAMVIWNATLSSWVLIECTGGALQAAAGAQSNQAVNLGQFLASLSGSGYQKLPSGLIIQWGTGVAASAGAAFTFPLTFPTACYSFSVSNNGGTSGYNWLTTSLPSTTGGTMQSSTASNSYSYIAIGK